VGAWASLAQSSKPCLGLTPSTTCQPGPPRPTTAGLVAARHRPDCSARPAKSPLPYGRIPSGAVPVTCKWPGSLQPLSPRCKSRPLLASPLRASASVAPGWVVLGGLRGGCAPRRLLRKPRQEAAASRRRWQARPGRRTRTMTTLPASKSAAPAPRVLRQVEGRHPHCPWTRPSRVGGTAAMGSLSLCDVDGTHVGCKNSCHN